MFARFWLVIDYIEEGGGEGEGFGVTCSYAWTLERDTGGLFALLSLLSITDLTFGQMCQLITVQISTINET